MNVAKYEKFMKAWKLVMIIRIIRVKVMNSQFNK